MASIYDIAERAGVSISTVSRIMTGSANVRPDKAEAVKEAMAFFNYEPNQFARGLVKQKSNMIGLYIESNRIGDEEDGSFAYYTMSLISGVGEVLAKNGYNLVLIYGDEGRADFLDQLRQKRIDGIIFSNVPSCPAARKSLQNMEKDGYPSVYIGKRFRKSGMNVYAQFENYMFSSILYLYNKGHKNVMVFNDPIHEENVRRVIERAAEELDGITLHEFSVNGYYASRDELKNAIEKYIALGSDAITGMPVEMVPLLYAALEELGMHVPGDISVIATEHREGLGRMFYPQVSAMYVPALDIGRGAAEMLLKSIRTPASAEESRVYEARFIERDSVRDLG